MRCRGAIVITDAPKGMSDALTDVVYPLLRHLVRVKCLPKSFSCGWTSDGIYAFGQKAAVSKALVWKDD